MGLKIHLREVRISLPENTGDHYPFNVPALQNMMVLSLNQPVTIFVGENGSGKSTLLEAMARAAEMVTIGSQPANRDESLRAVQPLADKLKLVWNKRTHRGFFLRAEDFFGYIQQLRTLRQSMEAELSRIDQDYEGRSEYAKSLAKGPAAASLQGMQQRYGEDLDANSHGESFLTLFQSRFVPDGLYLLDEPEAALSPLRQLGLISMIKTMLPQGAQFIIATHSPILMAVPEAILLDFSQNPPAPMAYEDLEHVRLYRSFLEDPDAYLRRL